MGQLHSRLSISVGTKLLLSLLAMIFVLIAFLTWSAITIVGRDKQAESSQARITEATLAGTEFTNSLRHTLESLRPALFAEAHELEKVIEPLSTTVFIGNGSVDLTQHELKIRNFVTREATLQDLGIDPSALEISKVQLRGLVPDLAKNGYAFLNLTQNPQVPLIGVFLSRPRLEKDLGQAPIAFSISQMRQFGSELNALNLTIATRSGWVLFDTETQGTSSLTNAFADPLFRTALNSTTFGSYSYEFQNKKILGGYAFPGFDLVVLSRAEWQKAMKPAYDLTQQIILVGGLAVLISFIFVVFFSKTIMAPVARLFEATGRIANGHFDLGPTLNQDMRRQDEFGQLARSFQAMSAKIRELFGDRDEKIALEGELEIASTVQRNILPEPVFRNERIQIHSHYQSASQCGGDWWGFFEVRDKLIFGIADTTGHGLSSALMTVSARSCFSVLQKLAEDDPEFDFSPARMLSFTNRVVFEANGGHVNMTFFLGVLDFNQMSVRFSNAGHNPPWILRETDQGTELKSLVAAGPRLGEMRDPPAFQEKSFALKPYDLLFLYTDGIVEARDRAGSAYGKKRLRALLQAESQQSTEQVVEHLLADISRHKDGVALDDDITVACARILRGTA